MKVQIKTAGKTRILVVEDEALVAEDLALSLGELGYRVVGTASNAAEAVNMAEESEVDLVLMDIVLAGDTDGIEAAAQIRSRLGVPILYVTAFADAALLERAKATQPAGYLVKPFRASELRAGVEMALFRGALERRLAESEERYRAVVDTQAELICRYLPDGTLTFVNEAYRRYFGKNSEELIGRKFVPPIVEEDRGAVERHFSSFSPETPIQSHEVRVSGPNGSVRWLWWVDRAMYGDRGDVIEFQGVGQDITDRKRAEQELQAQRACFTSIVETSSEAIMVVNDEGLILYANESAAGFLGKSRDELVGSTLGHTPAPGAMTDMEVTLADGKQGVAEMRVEPTEWLGEKARLVKLQDITQRRFLEKQLWEAQKMESLGTLAGGIAHDFNNLLTVIQGNAELLLAEKKSGSQEYEDLRRILCATRNGTELVRRILTFSRRVEADLRPVDLNEEVRQVRKLLNRTIPKMIKVKLRLRKDLRRVNADRSQIEQVLLNLAVNARDAMSEGGKLTIETRNASPAEEFYTLHPWAQPGEYVALTVSDTGHGMTKEVLDHIFEPFFTTKEHGKGTGLGLSTVFGIVKVHCGHIECTSEPGIGTTFQVYFPATPMEKGLDASATREATAGGSETILVVDDEEWIRDLLKKALSNAGYDVLTGSNGEEALEIVRRRRGAVPLVILDLVMPGMGGRQCLEEILKVEPRTRVLLTSGRSIVGRTNDDVIGGACGFIGKPFVLRELLQAVREVLDAG